MDLVPPPREQDPPDAPTGSEREPAHGGHDRLAHRLKQVAKGDEAAFAAVYDETAPRLHGLVLRVLRNPAQSEEVTQEVFLEVWRRASRFDPGKGSAIGWLLTMAHRRAIDRVRSSQASVVRDDGWHARSREVDFDTTAEAATARIEAARVRSALDQMERLGRFNRQRVEQKQPPIARASSCAPLKPSPMPPAMPSMSAFNLATSILRRVAISAR